MTGYTYVFYFIDIFFSIYFNCFTHMNVDQLYILNREYHTSCEELFYNFFSFCIEDKEQETTAEFEYNLDLPSSKCCVKLLVHLMPIVLFVSVVSMRYPLFCNSVLTLYEFFASGPIELKFWIHTFHTKTNRWTEESLFDKNKFSFGKSILFIMMQFAQSEAEK